MNKRDSFTGFGVGSASSIGVVRMLCLLSVALRLAEHDARGHPPTIVVVQNSDSITNVVNPDIIL